MQAMQEKSRLNTLKRFGNLWKNEKSEREGPFEVQHYF